MLCGVRMKVGESSNAPAPQLRRALGLWDLVFYGIVVIQPTAPMPVYGVVSERAHGHVVTAVLCAMVAMLFTAISYGRMARVYPSAGSAFTYPVLMPPPATIPIRLSRGRGCPARGG
jgi:amino acid transporter